jgi:hypothetical protein
MFSFNTMKIVSAIFASLLLLSGCLPNSGNEISGGVRPENAAANIDGSVPSEGAGGESQAATAERLVADLYKAHDARKSPFFQTKDRALVDRYFTKQLADLIWKDATTSEGELGALDADPLYDAQDVEIKNFKVGAAEVQGEKATVQTTFSNFDEKKTITFYLTRVGNAWKISDIGYGRKSTLVDWLRSAPPTTAGPTGEFEGKYIVGDTTCIVKPVKMSFEVRWAKGSGVEIFAFDEGTTFASSLDADASNKFVFDDENYHTGTFHRNDGKKFPVRRAK